MAVTTASTIMPPPTCDKKLAIAETAYYGAQIEKAEITNLFIAKQ